MHKIIANNDIKSETVFVINSYNEKIGNITIKEALSMANEEDLDLIQIAVNGDIPVCKIMDKSKYLYELKKKVKKQSKNSKKVELKEVRISPNIAENDLKVKEKTARRILNEGCELKVTMQFRGREALRMEYFTHLLNKFAEDLSDCAKVKNGLKINERNAFIILKNI